MAYLHPPVQPRTQPTPPESTSPSPEEIPSRREPPNNASRGRKRTSEHVEEGGQSNSSEPSSRRQRITETLTSEQLEDAEFVQYMETYLKRGFKLNQSRSKVYAHRKAFRERAGNNFAPRSGEWDAKFFKRYPKALQWHLPRAGNDAPHDRVIDCQAEAICDLLKEISVLMSRELIPKHNVYFAINTGYLASGKLARGCKTAIKRPQQPGNVQREARSVIYAFSAAGITLDPYFVFRSNEQTGQGEEVHTSSGRRLRAFNSDKEWADEQAVMDWFFKVFNPATKGDRGNERPCRILVVEEERFPISKELYASCWGNNVFVFSISNTTPGKLILKHFDELVLGEKFGVPYDTFAKREMAHSDEKFSVGKDKLVDWIYGKVRQPDLASSVKSAFKSAYLMPASHAQFREFFERNKPTPRHPPVTPAPSLRNETTRNISPTSDMSSPTVVRGEDRGGRSLPNGPHPIAAGGRTTNQPVSPMSQGHVDSYPYRPPDWPDDEIFSQGRGIREDPDLPTPPVSRNAGRQGHGRLLPSLSPGRTSSRDRRKLQDLREQVQRLHELSGTILSDILSESWIERDQH